MFSRMILPMLACILFSPNIGFAGPAVLIEEVLPENQSGSSRTKSNSTWINREKPISEGKSLGQIYQSQDFESSLSLRERRRVGVGGSFLGAQGLAGVLVELNLSSVESAVAAFGAGSGYNTFGFHWKHHLSGRTLTPYTSLGYTKWVNSGNNTKSFDQTTPNFLSGRFLSQEEKRSGRFSKDVFSGNFGFQFYKLDGPSSGLSFFAEVALLIETSDLSPVPTGGVGSLFYF